MAATVTPMRRQEEQKPAPHNIEIERALLSSILVSQGAVLPDVMRKIGKHSFYSEECAGIFAAMCGIFSQFGRVDYPLLYAALQPDDL